MKTSYEAQLKQATTLIEHQQAAISELHTQITTLQTQDREHTVIDTVS
jgi:hypothetical protein